MDVGTGVIMLQNKKKFLHWFKPSFLLSLENNWPKMSLQKEQIIDVTLLFINKREVKSEATYKALTPSDKFLTLINYYSDFHRLIRAICYIFRVARVCLIKKKKKENLV